MSLRVEGLLKAYGSRAVLRGIDLEVAPGEVYGLLGPNGSGKSTVLRVVAGLQAADGGRVTFEGERLSGAARGCMGFVPQEPALYPLLSCEETLRFFGRVYGVPRRSLPERVEGAIRATGLEPYRVVRAEALSGGWRQRLSVAIALVHGPELLVLDEPTTGLDVEVRYEIWDLIGALAARGASVLLASHTLAEAESHCHRVGILSEGRIVAEGSPEELRRLVPAAEIAEIAVEDATALLARCGERGWDVRRRGMVWVLPLKARTALPDLARELSGLPLRSLSLRSVSLEDVFLEVVGEGGSRPAEETSQFNPGSTP